MQGLVYQLSTLTLLLPGPALIFKLALQGHTKSGWSTTWLWVHARHNNNMYSDSDTGNDNSSSNSNNDNNNTNNDDEFAFQLMMS